MPQIDLPGMNMIDLHPDANQTIKTPPPSTKHGRGRFFFTVMLFFMALLLFVSGNLMQRQMRHLDEEINNDRARIKALEEHVRDMQEQGKSTPRVSSTSPQPLGEENTNPDVAHLQSDLAAMSTALNALQNEVKATGTVASQTKETAQASVTSL